MAAQHGDGRDALLEELRAWVRARALPEVADRWDEGYEFLRERLGAWVAERGGEDPYQRPRGRPDDRA